MKHKLRILTLVTIILIFAGNCASVRKGPAYADRSIRKKYSSITTIVDVISLVDMGYVDTPDWYRISIDTVNNMRKQGANYIDLRASDNGFFVGCGDDFKHYDHSSFDGNRKYAYAESVYQYYRSCRPAGKEKDTSTFKDLYIPGMMKSLDHSSYITVDNLIRIQREMGTGSIGIKFVQKEGKIIIVSAVHDSPAEKVGIRAKDVVTAIDNELTTGMTLEDAKNRMMGTVGTEVTLWIVHESQTEPKAVTIKREIVNDFKITRKDMGDGIAYVKLESFGRNTDLDLDKELSAQANIGSGLKGLVLDLRDNPGGLLDQAIKIAGMFLDSGPIVSIDSRIQAQKKQFLNEKRGSYLNFPIVIIVNHGTAAGSEIVVGALQDRRNAIILGTQTYGNSTIQTIVPLEDGSALRYTTARWYMNNGRSIQDKGIIPDILLGDLGDKSGKETEEGGNDPVLEAGLKVLRSRSSNPLSHQ